MVLDLGLGCLDLLYLALQLIKRRFFLVQLLLALLLDLRAGLTVNQQLRSCRVVLGQLFSQLFFGLVEFGDVLLGPRNFLVQLAQ